MSCRLRPSSIAIISIGNPVFVYQRQILGYLIALIVNRHQNRKDNTAVRTQIGFRCKDLTTEPAMPAILVEYMHLVANQTYSG